MIQKPGLICSNRDAGHKSTPLKAVLSMPALLACALLVVFGPIFGYTLAANAHCNDTHPITQAAEWALLTLLMFAPMLMVMAEPLGFLICSSAIVVFAFCIMAWAWGGCSLARIAKWALAVAVSMGLIVAMIVAIAGVQEKCGIGF